MSEPVNISNEQEAAKAFSKQSSVFDELYTPNTIVQYKRERVRKVVEELVRPGSTILELNAGTGEDATYFATKGYKVHATDIAEGMLKELRTKVKNKGLDNKVSTELCSYTQMAELKNKGPYDLIFSNFAGLNCTGELSKVLHSFKPLLKPGGRVVLVILPSFCLWETLMLFRGKFKTAFRRWGTKNGRTAYVEGVPFKCWYYDPSFIISTLKNDYNVIGLEGLCTIVPPSYIEHFAERHTRLFNFLKKWEEKLKNKWPWKSIGDYYIISLKLK